MEEQLKIALSQAISEFNNNRVAIIQLAYSSGGQVSLNKVEQEYDTLRDAYFELLRHQLDQNNHLYKNLIDSANSETENLRVSINKLNNINEIIDLATAIINLVGRILIILGV